MTKINLLFISFTASLLLAGCVSREQPPSLNVVLPENWSSQSNQFTTKYAHLSTWWRAYNSPSLNQLVESALNENTSLEEAAKRILSARALARVQGGQNKPTLESNTKVSAENRISGNPLGLNAGGEALGEGSIRTVGTFLSSLDAKWEIDLFGRLKAQNEAAKKGVEIAENDRDDIQVTLIAEIVKTYTEYQSALSKIGIVQSEINNRKALVNLIEKQKTAGSVGQFDMHRVISSLEITRAKLSNHELAAAIAVKRLQTLTHSKNINLLLKKSQLTPLSSPSLTQKMSIDIIRARPDIRKAEAIVLQRGLEADVALADLYPRLFLVGVLDLKMSLIGKPVLGSLVTLGGTPLLSIPLFDWGMRKNVLASKEALWRESIASYKGAIFKAIEDVEIARANVHAARKRIERQTAAFKASQKAHAIADKLYQGGSIGLTERLHAETEVRQTELELADARELSALAPIMLYKAIAAGSFSYKRIP